MEEQNLIKLSLIVSLTGILIILFISESIEIKEYKIKDISEEQLDKEVKVEGAITRITETPGLIIFNLNDKTGEITTILFKEEPINLTLNQKVQVQGKVIKYKNKLEIEANQIIS